VLAVTFEVLTAMYWDVVEYFAPAPFHPAVNIFVCEIIRGMLTITVLAKAFRLWTL
jgi:hypothetical protein